jgi:hypothetical protein
MELVHHRMKVGRLTGTNKLSKPRTRKINGKWYSLVLALGATRVPGIIKKVLAQIQLARPALRSKFQPFCATLDATTSVSTFARLNW